MNRDPLWPLSPRSTRIVAALVFAALIVAVWLVLPVECTRCYLVDERNSGSVKTCIYDCAGDTAYQTVGRNDRCPRTLTR